MPTPRGIYMGAELRELRERHNLTQTAIAAACGLATSNLSAIENDHRRISDAKAKSIRAAIKRLARKQGTA